MRCFPGYLQRVSRLCHCSLRRCFWLTTTQWWVNFTWRWCRWLWSCRLFACSRIFPVGRSSMSFSRSAGRGRRHISDPCSRRVLLCWWSLSCAGQLSTSTLSYRTPTSGCQRILKVSLSLWSRTLCPYSVINTLIRTDLSLLFWRVYYSFLEVINHCHFIGFVIDWFIIIGWYVYLIVYLVMVFWVFSYGLFSCDWFLLIQWDDRVLLMITVCIGSFWASCKVRLGRWRYDVVYCCYRVRWSRICL